MKISNKSNIILSFCIPTFNRGDVINNTIKSILASIKFYKENVNYEFEIVVSDNNSTDLTEKNVKEMIFQKNCENIHIIYNKNSENIGASNNFMHLSNLASGKYVWFFSDDDGLKIEAVSELFKIIKLNFTFIYFSRILTDLKLHPIPRINAQPYIESLETSFQNGREMIKKMGLEITNILGFFSSVIVLREKWDVSKDKVDVFSEFGYLKVIFRLIYDNPCFVVKEPCVLCRIDYRGFGNNNSKVWIDDYIKAFNYAMEIGFDKKSCLTMIHNIFNHHSKMFISDKIKGYRKGNLFNVKKKMNIKTLYFNRWFVISVLPKKILAPLYYLFKLIR